MKFISHNDVVGALSGRRVALVGSGPGCLDNEPGFIDSHDVVVRVNNHKCGPNAGFRTDVHYSFYGTSIKKTPADLKAEGCGLVICKCPNAQFIDSYWHRRMKKPHGIDFRYIYRRRANWWFCDTYVPSLPEFMAGFNLLGRHVPTTGFAAILEILSCCPESLYLTGYDFFSSGIHNVNEPWRNRNPGDPIGHAPERERAWLEANIDRYPIVLDRRLGSMMMKRAA
jgi:hypothetical protein